MKVKLTDQYFTDKAIEAINLSAGNGKMSPRDGIKVLLKKVARDQRHACAEAMSESDGFHEAHAAVLNA